VGRGRRSDWTEEEDAIILSSLYSGDNQARHDALVEAGFPSRPLPVISRRVKTLRAKNRAQRIASPTASPGQFMELAKKYAQLEAKEQVLLEQLTAVQQEMASMEEALKSVVADLGVSTD